MRRTDLPLRGTYLKTDIDWLVEHAYLGKVGECRCNRTNALIESRVTHRYSVGNCGKVFTAQPAASGGGSLITFMSLRCPACDVGRPMSPELRLSDLLYIEET